MGDGPAAQDREGPDHFFVGDVGRKAPLIDRDNRWSDGGPIYKESYPLETLGTRSVAEPYNAVTASFFVLIVAGWLWRLRGRYARYPFLTACAPILLAGGIGGTLYHATRTSVAYFLLDVIPISLLGAAGAVYLTVRLGRAVGLWRVLGAAVGLLAVYLLVNGVLFQLLPFENRNLRVNLSYLSLAVMLLIPLAVVLVKTRFRYWAWVAGGLVSFAIAWFCRLVDGTPWGDLPMGTHWLWHTFGAVTTQAVTEYFYRIEGRPLTADGGGE
jgi:hypothetical protein